MLATADLRCTDDPTVWEGPARKGRLLVVCQHGSFLLAAHARTREDALFLQRGALGLTSGIGARGEIVYNRQVGPARLALAQVQALLVAAETPPPRPARQPRRLRLRRAPA